MAYGYIKRAYAFQPQIGHRVQHTVTKKFGVIARESPGQAHYVRVRFDGQKFSLPCHPDELKYAEPAQSGTA